MDSITNAISDNCEPKIIPDLSLRNIEDKILIVVNVFPGTMRPYYLKSKGVLKGTYLRVRGTTRPAEPYMIKDLILEGENRFFDKEPCLNLKITDKEIEALCTSMKEVALQNTWKDNEKAHIRDLKKK